jgi:hypothetical protein
VRHADIGQQGVIVNVPETLDGLIRIFNAIALEALAPKEPGSRFPEGLQKMVRLH